MEVGDDKAITKVGQTFRDMLMAKPAPPSVVIPAESAATVTTTSTTTSGVSSLQKVEPGTGEHVRPEDRNENDVYVSSIGTVYKKSKATSNTFTHTLALILTAQVVGSRGKYLPLSW